MTCARFDFPSISGENPSGSLTLKTEEGQVVLRLHVPTPQVEDMLSAIICFEGRAETTFIQLCENIIAFAKPIA